MLKSTSPLSNNLKECIWETFPGGNTASNEFRMRYYIDEIEDHEVDCNVRPWFSSSFFVIVLNFFSSFPDIFSFRDNHQEHVRHS